MNFFVFLSTISLCSCINIVRSISINNSISVMKKWALELKMRELGDMLSNEVINADYRKNDDSVSGPFAFSEPFKKTQETEKIALLHDVIGWIETKSIVTEKCVFVADLETGEEAMMALVEKINKNGNMQVNGFLASPFSNTKEHDYAYNFICSELLNVASQANKNILFVFNDS